MPAANQLAAKYRVRVDDILGLCRERWTCVARQHFWLLIRDSWDLSYPEMGKLLDRDHTTIMWGVRKHRERIEREVAA